MMKAAVVTSYTGPLEIKQVPIPQPGSNDVLVKLIACGVCHSDLSTVKGKGWQVPLPRIVGHEGIGEIVELGSNVGDHVKRGDIVGVPWIQKTCLHCEYCLTGRETLCARARYSGSSTNGCFAEYALIDADFAVKLPEGMDPFTSAPFYCAGVTVYKAPQSFRSTAWSMGIYYWSWWTWSVTFFLQDLTDKIIYDCLGSLAISYAVAMGLQVVAIVAPNDKTAVKLAKDMGAKEIYDGPSEKHGEWVQEKVHGVQTAIVTVPLLEAYAEAFKSVKRGGRVVAVALPPGNISVPIVDFIIRGIQLVASVVGTRRDLQEALELAKLHNITSKVEKRKLEDINEIFDDMQHYKISGRVVIDFSQK